MAKFGSQKMLRFLLFVVLMGFAAADLLDCEFAMFQEPVNAILNGDQDMITLTMNRILLSGHRINDLG
jgi:hypothetical protein